MSVRKFSKPYDGLRQRCFSGVGSRFADKMCAVVDSRGNRHLEKVGETDIYQLIQSFRDSTDLQRILERVMQSGDVSLLQKAQGIYADITGLPCEPRVAHDLLNHAKFAYESLDQRMKVMYSSFDDFLEAFATKENFELFAKNAQSLNPNITNGTTVPEGGAINES